jgi:hypothetical protein
MTRVQTQWPVFHVCGHRQEHDLTKITPKDRESRARWLATRVCTKCWKSLTSEPAAGPGAAPAAADTWTQVRPLTLLEGPPKQVTWATSIRATMITRLWENRAKTGMDPDEFVRRVEGPAKRTVAARFWIDHRDVALGDLEQLLHDVSNGDRARGGS